MTTDELLEAFPVTEITPQGDEVRMNLQYTSLRYLLWRHPISCQLNRDNQIWGRWYYLTVKPLILRARPPKKSLCTGFSLLWVVEGQLDHPIKDTQWGGDPTGNKSNSTKNLWMLFFLYLLLMMVVFMNAWKWEPTQMEFQRQAWTLSSYFQYLQTHHIPPRWTINTFMWTDQRLFEV